jgi:hypothetical protein
MEAESSYSTVLPSSFRQLNQHSRPSLPEDNAVIEGIATCGNARTP